MGPGETAQGRDVALSAKRESAARLAVEVGDVDDVFGRFVDQVVRVLQQRGGPTEESDGRDIPFGAISEHAHDVGIAGGAESPDEYVGSGQGGLERALIGCYSRAASR